MLLQLTIPDYKHKKASKTELPMTVTRFKPLRHDTNCITCD